MRLQKISTKLSLGFFLIVCTFLLLSGVTAWKLSLVPKAPARRDTETHLLHLAEKWQANVKQNSARALAGAYSEGKAMGDFFKDSVDAVTRDTTETQKAFLALVQDGAGRKAADHVGEVRKAWLVVRDQINALKAAGDEAGAKALVQSKFIAVTDDYIRTTQTLVDDQINDIHDTRQQIEAMFRQLYLVGGLLLLLSIAIAIFVSWTLSRTIARGIDGARIAAQRIGAGDLSQPLSATGQDEIGQLVASLPQMQGSLINVVTSVRQGSEGVAAASAEIAMGN